MIRLLITADCRNNEGNYLKLSYCFDVLFSLKLLEILGNVKCCCHPEEVVVTLCLTLSPLSALSVCAPFLVYTLIPFPAFYPSQSDSQTLSQALVDCILFTLDSKEISCEKDDWLQWGPLSVSNCR